MRRIDRLGQELVYALRRRNERRELYEAAASEVSLLEAEIMQATQEELHASTGSFPAVPDDRPTERFAAPEFEQCPGYGCVTWEQGKEHAHIGGRIWTS